MKFSLNKKWIGLAVAVAVVAIPVALKSHRGSKGLPVEVETAARREIRPTILASGLLAYRTEVDLRSEVTARVAQLLVAEGDDVKAGQLLLRLDPESYRNAIDREEANLRQTQLSIDQQRMTLQLRKLQFERSKKLLEAKMIEPSRFDTDKNALELAEVELRQSQAALARAEAVLREARQQLGKTEIRAPISGRVVALPIKVGETAIPSIASQAGAQLLTIADTSAIQAELKVDEGDIGKVSLGQRVDIYPAAYPDTALVGKVERVALASTTEGQSRAYKVTVALSPDPKLKLRSGMSARAEIFLADGTQRLAVPVEAVVTEDDEATRKRKHFIVIARDGEARRVEVELGLSDDRWQEVIKGLNVGDAVIVAPGKALRDLKNGDKVEPKPHDPKSQQTGEQKDRQ